MRQLRWSFVSVAAIVAAVATATAVASLAPSAPSRADDDEKAAKRKKGRLVSDEWKTEKHPDGAAPRVDIVFCLDTTGSMQKVIDAAKAKIREIARWVGTGEPTPTVRFAIVGYRDPGEAYITKTWPLTPDVEKVERVLGEIRAEAGGDAPEHVVAGLHESVFGIDWDFRSRLRFVFLLGDAPPHFDYGEESDAAPILKAAVDSEIIVTTFVCGDGMGEKGTAFFEDVAEKTHGSFERIASLDDLALESVIFAAIAKRAREVGIEYPK